MLPNNPAIPSFESPVELLCACHGKIRRFATLCERLAAHTTAQGADEEARSAASAILRYFTVAVPLHHDDEDQDLFPALRELRDDSLMATMRALEQEHGELEALWEQVRPWLEGVQQGSARAAPEAMAQLASRYRDHIDREEREVFGCAARLPAPVLREIGERMARRRGG